MTVHARGRFLGYYINNRWRAYDVFWPLELSSKCYLAAFIAILAFLMWPNIIVEFNRYMLWNINDIRAAVSEEFRIITETGLH
jgi:hypothetical protein